MEFRNRARGRELINFWQRWTAIQWREESLFDQGCWNSCTFIHRKMNFGSISYTIYKNNSKWITDTNVKSYTITLSGIHIGWNLYNRRLGKDFSHTHHKHDSWNNKSFVNLDFIKIKGLYSLKDTVKMINCRLEENNCKSHICQTTYLEYGYMCVYICNI